MTDAEKIAEYLRRKGARRCPTAAVAETSARIHPLDSKFLRRYRDAADAADAPKPGEKLSGWARYWQVRRK